METKREGPYLRFPQFAMAADMSLASAITAKAIAGPMFIARTLRLRAAAALHGAA